MWICLTCGATGGADRFWVKLGGRSFPDCFHCADCFPPLENIPEHRVPTQKFMRDFTKLALGRARGNDNRFIESDFIYVREFLKTHPWHEDAWRMCRELSEEGGVLVRNVGGYEYPSYRRFGVSREVAVNASKRNAYRTAVREPTGDCIVIIPGLRLLKSSSGMRRNMGNQI